MRSFVFIDNIKALFRRNDDIMTHALSEKILKVVQEECKVADVFTLEDVVEFVAIEKPYIEDLFPHEVADYDHTISSLRKKNKELEEALDEKIDQLNRMGAIEEEMARLTEQLQAIKSLS